MIEYSEDIGTVLYKKYNNNAVIVFDRGSECTLVANPRIIENIRKKLGLEKSQHALVVNIYTDNYGHSIEDLESMEIIIPGIDEYSYNLYQCKDITLDEVKQDISLATSQSKSFYEYIMKNTKELSYEEKVYMLLH